MKTKKVLTFFLFISLFFIALTACSQDKISSQEASKYIGKEKTVCGKVVNTFYSYNSKGKPTFLNLDKPYPNQIFTVVIWYNNRAKFENKPEIYYKDKNICVTGVISSYRGKPQIEIKDVGQIKIKN